MGKAVGRVVGDITGSNQQATAAGRAAQAQEAVARRNQRFAKEQMALGLKDLDKYGPQELAALEGSLKQQQTALDRQSQLFDAMDPAILEASSQALKLLRGEDAAALAPIRNDRQRQRQSLLNTLREQLGPGAETSTAGIQALNQFDQETSGLLAGQQQQTLGQLFGMGQTGAANRGSLNQSIGALANIGQGFGDMGLRRANVRQSFTGAALGAGQALQQAAGSRFVKDQFQGAGQMAVIGPLLQAGASAAMGGAGGKPPTG